MDLSDPADGARPARFAAATLLGIGRTKAYELVRTDAWPTPVIRLGKLIKVATRPLLDLLEGRVGPAA